MDENSYEFEARLAEAEAFCPDGRESVIAESAVLCLFDFEPHFADEVAEGLDIPRIEVMIGLVGVVRTIAFFFFERNEQ